jgi:hypothetical protein
MKTPAPPTDPKIHEILIELLIQKVEKEYSDVGGIASHLGPPPAGWVSWRWADQILTRRGIISKAPHEPERARAEITSSVWAGRGAGMSV